MKRSNITLRKDSKKRPFRITKDLLETARDNISNMLEILANDPSINSPSWMVTWDEYIEIRSDTIEALRAVLQSVGTLHRESSYEND